MAQEPVLSVVQRLWCGIGIIPVPHSQFPPRDHQSQAKATRAFPKGAAAPIHLPKSHGNPPNHSMIPKISSCHSKRSAHGAACGQWLLFHGDPGSQQAEILFSIFTFPSHPPQTAPLHSSICLNAISERDWLGTASPLIIVSSLFSSSGFACLIPGIRQGFRFCGAWEPGKTCQPGDRARGDLKN